MLFTLPSTDKYPSSSSSDLSFVIVIAFIFLTNWAILRPSDLVKKVDYWAITERIREEREKGSEENKQTLVSPSSKQEREPFTLTSSLFRLVFSYIRSILVDFSPSVSVHILQNAIE